MKLDFFKWGFQSLFVILLVASCSSNNETVQDLELVDIEDFQDLVAAEDVSSEIDLIVDELDIETLFKAEVVGKSLDDNCFTKTTDISNQTKTTTFDFGDGCTNERGKVRAGKIIIVQQREPGSFSKTVSFENFSVDGKNIEGSKSTSIFRENSNGNKEQNFTSDIKITLITNEVISLSQNKTREMVEGSETFRRGDDVYVVTGSSNYVNKDGEEMSTLITEDLTRSYACRYVISGKKQVTKKELVYTIDFGDGTCDDIAIVSDTDGNTKEITLKSK